MLLPQPWSQGLQWRRQRLGQGEVLAPGSRGTLPWCHTLCTSSSASLGSPDTTWDMCPSWTVLGESRWTQSQPSAVPGITCAGFPGMLPEQRAFPLEPCGGTIALKLDPVGLWSVFASDSPLRQGTFSLLLKVGS